MKTIIAGSRECSDYAELRKAVAECGWTPTLVLSGSARGVDLMGELWADIHGVEVLKFPAAWAMYGNQAGPIRNALMASKADALIALWDGKSKGTKHMIDIATRKGLKVYVHLLGS